MKDENKQWNQINSISHATQEYEYFYFYLDFVYKNEHQKKRTATEKRLMVSFL